MTDSNWIEHQGPDGRCIRMTASWSDAFIPDLQGVAELELNYADGWSCEDYSFLDRFPDLRVLRITDWTTDRVCGLDGLQSLRELKLFTYCRSTIPFDRLPKLTTCSFEWRPAGASVLDHGGLRTLFINQCPARTFEPFRRMSSLERLTLASPQLESLAGLGDLKLGFLAIERARRLKSLEGVEAAHQLRELEINGCRGVRSLTPLAALAGLRRLQLRDNGDIESLAPLSGLTDLERLLFTESTDIVDGDLSVLLRLPRLRHVAFRDRPTYSHTRTDIARVQGGDAGA